MRLRECQHRKRRRFVSTPPKPRLAATELHERRSSVDGTRSVPCDDSHSVSLSFVQLYVIRLSLSLSLSFSLSLSLSFIFVYHGSYRSVPMSCFTRTDSACYVFRGFAIVIWSNHPSLWKRISFSCDASVASDKIILSFSYIMNPTWII